MVQNSSWGTKVRQFILAALPTIAAVCTGFSVAIHYSQEEKLQVNLKYKTFRDVAQEVAITLIKEATNKPDESDNR
jgi:hypothetical protein